MNVHKVDNSEEDSAASSKRTVGEENYFDSECIKEDDIRTFEAPQPLARKKILQGNTSLKPSQEILSKSYKVVLVPKLIKERRRAVQNTVVGGAELTRARTLTPKEPSAVELEALRPLDVKAKAVVPKVAKLKIKIDSVAPLP